MQVGTSYNIFRLIGKVGNGNNISTVLIVDNKVEKFFEDVM